MTPRSVRLSVLLEDSQVVALGAIGADPEILGATVDSRNVEPGNLFVAIRGMQTDGESYVPEALQRGARAVVAGSRRPRELDPGIGWVQVDEPRRAAGLLARECYGRPDEALTLAGITGTNGKTTVTYILDSIGRCAGRNTGRIGTVGASFAGKGQGLSRTTPEAPDLYKLLDEMRDARIDFVAMEVSSHALALSRVEGVRFDLAAFLNLSRDHLDFHGDEESYFRSKAKLFETLDPESRAVLPADSPYGDRLRKLCRGETLSFGRSSAADVRMSDEHCGLDGSSAILETPSGKLPIRTFLPGAHNLENVAAAAACALALGLPPESIPSGVLALEQVPGRMQKVDRGQPFSAIVDYAHTPAALERLLTWLRGETGGRLCVVFGCGGGRDATKRAPMGRVAAELADRIVLTSDNPRHEDPESILDAIAEGVAGVEGGMQRCTRVVGRREAITTALRAARPGDVVVVAGKGHEGGQQIGSVVHPFDDRRVIEEILEQSSRGGDGVAGA
jgi:UDP-N-acetylmuramoyl-L-alanyl-D-glutamate--2,6-diaminopimelate ligase